MTGTFIEAYRLHMQDLMRMLCANEDAAMMGRALPYPSGPPSNYARPDDPCDDWSNDEDYDY